MTEPIKIGIGGPVGAGKTQLIEKVDEMKIPYERVHVDPLVFPISVSPLYGPHFIDAVKTIRNRFGSELHISGGLSNVSFGLPNRKLINDVFIYLCLDSGIDSGIIDPVQTNINNVFELDISTFGFKVARDMLLGKDGVSRWEISTQLQRGLKARKLLV